MGDTKHHHCGECKQMWPDRDVMMGRRREGDRKKEGGASLLQATFPYKGSL